MFHKDTVGIKVYAAHDSIAVYLPDSNQFVYTPAKINIERSTDDVELIVRKDSLTKKLLLKSKVSNTFWFGNLFGLNLPGFIIDGKSPRRFTYPKEHFLVWEPWDKSEYVETLHYLPPTRRQLNVKLSIPLVNHFGVNTGYKNTQYLGFLGISAGLEYYINNNLSLNTDVGVISNYSPFRSESDSYIKQTNKASILFMDIQAGTNFRKFHLDVGFQVNYSRYSEDFIFDTQSIKASWDYASYELNAGMAFSGYYALSSYFNIGVNYYPSAFHWQGNTFSKRISHMAMLDLIFKIKAFRPSN